MKSATASAYSSSANLGPGFDSIGLAHDACRNRVTVSLIESSPRIVLEVISSKLPSDPLKNTASLAIKGALETAGKTGKFRITIEDGIPVGLGLGSSGSSAAAAVAAIDSLLEIGLKPEEKVYHAMLGETASSGTPHADNVAASVVGGLVTVESTNPMKISSLSVSDKFSFLTVVPQIRMESKTRISRSLVPSEISMEEHIAEIRHVSLLLSGFIEGNSAHLRAGMNDGIVEKARLNLFPFYPEIKEIALSNHAAGVCISGAGPSILMALDNTTDVSSILEGVKSTMQKSGLMFSVYRSKVAGGASLEEN